jgi:hypothetical protein
MSAEAVLIAVLIRPYVECIAPRRPTQVALAGFLLGLECLTKSERV